FLPLGNFNNEASDDSAAWNSNTTFRNETIHTDVMAYNQIKIKNVYLHEYVYVRK
ncbi:hypothetical protein COBT_003495, partial [Conglomerata obtusa]